MFFLCERFYKISEKQEIIKQLLTNGKSCFNADETPKLMIYSDNLNSNLL